jgi:hypothetical protein
MRSQVMKYLVKRFQIAFGNLFRHAYLSLFLALQLPRCISFTAILLQSRPRRVLMVFPNPRNSCWICLPLGIPKISLRLIGRMHGLTVSLSSKGLRRRTSTSTSSPTNTSFHSKRTLLRNLKLTNASTSGFVGITPTPVSNLHNNSTKRRSSNSK